MYVWLDIFIHTYTLIKDTGGNINPKLLTTVTWDRNDLGGERKDGDKKLREVFSFY